MTEITMPRLSDSMEEGTILKWLIADGAQVSRGEELVEIETDKATIAHLSEGEGTLVILAPEGSMLPVGAPIARLGEGAAPAPMSAPAAAPEPAPPPERALLATNGSGPAVRSPDTGEAGSVRATPLARRAARLHEVRLELLTGSGLRGRVTRADVFRAAGIDAPPLHQSADRERRDPSTPAGGTRAGAHARASDPFEIATPHEQTAPPQTTTAGSGTGGAKGETRRVQASRQQQLVARRMAEAKATIPHFQVQSEVEMDRAIALRAGLKASANGDGVPSLNDLLVKASATALRRHPRANGSYSDGGFELYSRINVGVAVAAEEGLIVPVVMDADRKSLGAIARETRQLAERVRDGSISPPELSGATFTVSNLGMFGMSAITPVINPPQAAILGVGALRETLARREGEIVDRTLMTLTLSCDHRILYGADAARLLAEIRELLEAPLSLAL
jgi:pyruvate dehydrogenase E2 component (dihydrolipoamide acetyltransferase)